LLAEFDVTPATVLNALKQLVPRPCDYGSIINFMDTLHILASMCSAFRTYVLPVLMHYIDGWMSAYADALREACPYVSRDRQTFSIQYALVPLLLERLMAENRTDKISILVGACGPDPELTYAILRDSFVKEYQAQKKVSTDTAVKEFNDRVQIVFQDASRFPADSMNTGKNLLPSERWVSEDATANACEIHTGESVDAFVSTRDFDLVYLNDANFDKGVLTRMVQAVIDRRGDAAVIVSGHPFQLGDVIGQTAQACGDATIVSKACDDASEEDADFDHRSVPSYFVVSAKTLGDKSIECPTDMEFTANEFTDKYSFVYTADFPEHAAATSDYKGPWRSVGRTRDARGMRGRIHTGYSAYSDGLGPTDMLVLMKGRVNAGNGDSEIEKKFSDRLRDLGENMLETVVLVKVIAAQQLPPA
jgi:hypothetical protein